MQTAGDAGVLIRAAVARLRLLGHAGRGTGEAGSSVVGRPPFVLAFARPLDRRGGDAAGLVLLFGVVGRVSHVKTSVVMPTEVQTRFQPQPEKRARPSRGGDGLGWFLLPSMVAA